MCIGLGIAGLPGLSKKCHFDLPPNWVLARYCLWKYYLQVSGPLVGADVSGCNPCQKREKLFCRYELSQVTHTHDSISCCPVEVRWEYFRITYYHLNTHSASPYIYMYGIMCPPQNENILCTFTKAQNAITKNIKTEHDNGNLLDIQLPTHNVIKCVFSYQHCWE